MIFFKKINLYCVFNFNNFLLYQNNIEIYKWAVGTILLVLVNLIPLLICIAFFTVAERKLLASLQRRTGPMLVGYWGVLQALADGFKLVIKEIVIPAKVNFFLYLLAPVLALFLTFLSWSFLPLGLTSFYIYEEYNILILLAISSINVYTIVIAGWSSNSKYSFLGGLRSSAQMISYEISISLILIPIFLTSGSLNLIKISAIQENIWFIFSLFPISIPFLVSILAETNRAPFDLPEAEAELVAGFNLEYSSIIFALFFLAEYGNMILMSTLFSMLFLGGWNSFFFCSYIGPMNLLIKILLVCVVFVIVRGNLPRYRYDQLIDVGWKIFLPITLSFLFFYISFLFCTNLSPVNPYQFLNLELQTFPHKG